MPDTAVALPDNGKPERQSHLPGDKVRAALDLMLWQGCHRDEAAKLAGIKPKSLYWALRKPHVKQYYLAGLRVLRESTRAKTFHRLEALRDQDENKAAAVKACQVLEHIADDPVHGRSGMVTSPGLVIQIIQAPLPTASRQPMTIDVHPEPAPLPEEPRNLWVPGRDEPVSEPIFRPRRW